LAGEIERLQLRLSYLHLKAEMWAARESGDTTAEQRATVEIVRLMRLFSDETTQEKK
jgi:hypothetical protein